ncbi:hypothetical protein NQ315_008661 [Exocentrus adspersus]|uniref:HAT C-terminal dimerisation domain-containing protein n=1 Tax=Exocentrus adspersus TaxID=1586481 RepID=A0AAV8W5X0_9CUCU|nr:hypothetical protein NQ315_008661 [Exocentrus adspersus]
MSNADKIKVKALGRPTPELNIETNASSRNKSYKRQFNSSVYFNTLWICGCGVKNALFCFPCLIFGGDKAWTVNGVKDLSHLSQSIRRHEVTLLKDFGDFFNVDTSSSAGSICSILDPLLKSNNSKLVAQVYDGAKHSNVHTGIKEKYPLAYLVHGYAHELNLIMPQVASQNTQVKVFFSNVDDVVNFFSNPQMVNVLNEVIDAVPTHWNFNKSRAVEVIHGHRSALIECMRIIQERFSNTRVINQASALERLLCDKVFVFWLEIFCNIMPHVDVLDNQVQTNKTETGRIKIAVDVFEKSISNIRNDLEPAGDLGKREDESEFEERISNSEPTIKKEEEFEAESEPVEERISNDLEDIIKKEEFVGEPVPKRIRMSEDGLFASALEVCDVVVETARTRFRYTNHLLASRLFLSEYFQSYAKSFPDEVFNTTVTTYPVFEPERLRTELIIIYTRSDFRLMNGAVAFLNMIKANSLENTFKEVCKLLEIIITIPMPTGEGERCFSTLKRVKTFLRNSMGEEELSALCMLSVEKCLIKSDVNFNEKVIDVFAYGKRHVSLIYKK